MEECDYCGKEFDDEGNYLEHLKEAHENELSRIDRRRVEQIESDGSSPTAVYALIAVLGVALVALAAGAYLTGNGDDPGTDNTGPSLYESLPDSGDQALLEDVQTFESRGRSHESGAIDYDHVPPTSGPHRGSWVSPGFYENPQQYEELVHNLEHGHVVVYYDPDALSDDAEADLRELVSTYDHDWAAVVVVPNPEDDPDATYTLTAWTKKLEMDDYDPEVVRAFLAEYLGRGPENPVR